MDLHCIFKFAPLFKKKSLGDQSLYIGLLFKFLLVMYYFTGEPLALDTMYKELNQSYIWSGLGEDITNYIKSNTSVESPKKSRIVDNYRTQHFSAFFVSIPLKNIFLKQTLQKLTFHLIKVMMINPMR